MLAIRLVSMPGATALHGLDHSVLNQFGVHATVGDPKDKRYCLNCFARPAGAAVAAPQVGPGGAPSSSAAGPIPAGAAPLAVAGPIPAEAAPLAVAGPIPAEAAPLAVAGPIPAEAAPLAVAGPSLAGAAPLVVAGPLLAGAAPSAVAAAVGQAPAAAGFLTHPRMPPQAGPAAATGAWLGPSQGGAAFPQTSCFHPKGSGAAVPSSALEHGLSPAHGAAAAATNRPPGGTARLAGVAGMHGSAATSVKVHPGLLAQLRVGQMSATTGVGGTAAWAGGKGVVARVIQQAGSDTSGRCYSAATAAAAGGGGEGGSNGHNALATTHATIDQPLRFAPGAWQQPAVAWQQSAGGNLPRPGQGGGMGHGQGVSNAKHAMDSGKSAMLAARQQKQTVMPQHVQQQQQQQKPPN